jgi:hypothetical protein
MHQVELMRLAGSIFRRFSGAPSPFQADEPDVSEMLTQRQLAEGEA